MKRAILVGALAVMAALGVGSETARADHHSHGHSYGHGYSNHHYHSYGYSRPNVYVSRPSSGIYISTPSFSFGVGNSYYRPSYGGVGYYDNYNYGGYSNYGYGGYYGGCR